MRLLCLVLLLSGCATHKDEWMWAKNGDNGTFDQDQGQCHAQAFAVPGAQLMQVAMVYDGCMRGKGWYKVAAPK